MRCIRKKSVSLKKNIMRAVLAMYFIFLIMVMVLLCFFIGVYQEKIENNCREILDSYSEKVQTSVDKTNEMVGNIFNSGELKGLDAQKNAYERLNKIYQLKGTVITQNSLSGIADALFVYYDDYRGSISSITERISLSEKKQLMEQCKAVLEKTEGTYDKWIQETETSKYYTVCYKKNGVAVAGNVKLSRSVQGTITERFPIVSGVVENGRLYVFTEGNGQEIIECQEIADGKSKQDSYVLYARQLEHASVALVVGYQDNLWAYISPAHMVIFLAVILSVFPAWYFFQVLNRQVLYPMKRLTDYLTLVQQGHWDAEQDIMTNISEIQEIMKTFKVTLEEIERWKIHAYEEEINRQQAQLQYFQLQMKPHFYTNCLKLLLAKIQTHRLEKIEALIIHLSIHLRYLMRPNMKLITVKQEIDFLNNYFELQKDLFERDFYFRITADNEAEEGLVPVLAIQTFVENSLKYASDSADEALMILVEVKYLKLEERSYLNITVKDNGKGYPEEMLEVLNHSMDSLYQDREGGTGIANLKNRIALLYGSDYSWYMSNQSGAVSEIILPYRTREKGEEE